MARLSRRATVCLSTLSSLQQAVVTPAPTPPSKSETESLSEQEDYNSLCEPDTGTQEVDGADPISAVLRSELTKVEIEAEAFVEDLVAARADGHDSEFADPEKEESREIDDSVATIRKEDDQSTWFRVQSQLQYKASLFDCLVSSQRITKQRLGYLTGFQANPTGRTSRHQRRGFLRGV